MGNGVGKLGRCFAGEVSRRHPEISLYLSDPLDVGLGHSFCYIRPDSSQINSDEFPVPFRTISGTCISANTYTPLTTTLIDPFSCTNSTTLDKASSFESSDSFASVPLQPINRNSVLGSGPVERGFLSGPIERSSIWSPEDQLSKSKRKSNKWCIMKTLSCSPSLCHHRIGPKDIFLILSSDGLYQYFTNEEAVAQVEVFTSLFPEGDPAQHLAEEVLLRAVQMFLFSLFCSLYYISNLKSHLIPTPEGIPHVEYLSLHNPSLKC